MMVAEGGEKDDTQGTEGVRAGGGDVRLPDGGRRGGGRARAVGLGGLAAAHRHTSEFYHHYEEDIAACAAKGIRALSLSFSWSRIMRRDGTVNPEGLAFYDRVIDACLRHGVEPFVALYHFDLPADLAPAGWLAPQTVEAYLRYARVCFRHFGARVRHWLTLKDPVTEVTQGYLTGLFPPGQKLALGRAVLALHKMLTAHAQAAHGLYKGRPKLDFERLKEIRSRVSVPLVLHGASDVPDELVEKAISLGITKVNIATALARGEDTQSILRLAAACGTANALEAESGFVRPDAVRALLPQIEITPITI